LEGTITATWSACRDFRFTGGINSRCFYNKAKTRKPIADPVKFGLVADYHQSGAAAAGKLTYLMQDYNTKHNVSAIISTGDMTDLGAANEQAAINVGFSSASVADSTIDNIFQARGNHDGGGVPHTWTVNASYCMRPGRTGMSSPHASSAFGSKDVGGIHIVVLDSSTPSISYMTDWLTTDLAAATTSAIVVTHHRLDQDWPGEMTRTCIPSTSSAWNGIFSNMKLYGVATTNTPVGTSYYMWYNLYGSSTIMATLMIYGLASTNNTYASMLCWGSATLADSTYVNSVVYGSRVVLNSVNNSGVYGCAYLSRTSAWPASATDRVGTIVGEQALAAGQYVIVGDSQYCVGAKNIRTVCENSGKVKLFINGHEHSTSAGYVNGIFHLNIPNTSATGHGHILHYYSDDTFDLSAIEPALGQVEYTRR
jgi:predicted phosphodiesterase